MTITLCALALSGCLGDDFPAVELGSLSVTFNGAYTWPAAVSHDAAGSRLPGHALLADPGVLPRVVEVLVPLGGAEPNIGVTSSGNLFVTTFDQVQRSADNGRTWEVVHDLVTPGHPTTQDMFSTADPMLWVDPDTDRVYVNHMHPALLCTYIAWSDDEGETWTDRPLACGPIPGIDHQKVMTAKPRSGIPTAGYPNVLYICNNKRFDGLLQEASIGTSCIVSLDGGLTYAYEREAFVTDELCSNVNGHPAAYPDGTVVFIMGSLGRRCERPFTAVLSEDNGLTWQVRQCDPELGQVEIDADVTVTPDGTAYVLFRDKDQVAHLLRTRDKFATCEHYRVAPPDHTLSVFAGITSGSDGRVAMAYLGTRDLQEDGANPSTATPGSVWHLFVTVSLDADAENPTFVTQQVTPEEDPVQIGCVWLSGGAGGPRECRNLLDFIDMTRDADGRFYVAITDGCVPRNGCTGTPEQPDFQSRDRQVAVAVQDSGISLFEEKGILSPFGLTWPEPLRR